MVSETTIIDALNQSFGNVSSAARAIGMSRRQMIRRIEASDYLKELIDDLRQSLVDEAEASIATSIRQGDVKTAQ